MAQEGISTLPQSPENAPQSFEQLLTSSKDELRKLYPEEAPAYDQGMEQIVQQLNLPLEELTVLKQILEYLLKNENQYPQLRQRLINEAGVRPEDIPEEFDRGYLMTMLVVVQEAIDRQQGQSQGIMGSSMPEPQGFQKGGLAGAAEALRQQGRGGDTILAHINPQEAQLLKAMGGSGTINPATGLLEFKRGPIGAIGKAVSGVGKAVGSAFNAVGNAVKSVVASPVGRIVATVALTAALGPGAFGIAGLGMNTAVAAALAGTSISLAGGSNLNTALKTGAISGAMAWAAPGLSKMLPGTGGYLNAAATGAIMGAGYGAVTGQNIGTSALTGGLLAGGLSAAGGAGAFGPGQTPAPIVDNSQILNADGTRAPLSGGAVSPSGEGISTLASGQTNLQAPVNRFDYTPSGEMVPANYSPEITGATPGISAPNAPVTMAGNVPVVDRSQILNADGTRSPLGTAPAPTSPGAPTAPQQSTGIGSYFDKAKDYLFSSDPKNPGFFYNSKGEISIPAVVGTGLALGAVTGGFQTQPVSPPGLVQRDANGNPITGEDLIRQDPNKYLVGGIPGYNAPYSPPPPVGYVPTPMYGPTNNVPTYSTYTPPPMAATANPNQRIMQPYNYNPYSFASPMYAAAGGIAQMYPRKTGAIAGPGTGTSDSIPAMLSDGEFVLTARAVKGAGGGSRREGAKKLYRMMHALEKKAGGKV